MGSFGKRAENVSQTFERSFLRMFLTSVNHCHETGPRPIAKYTGNYKVRTEEQEETLKTTNQPRRYH
jgi:hypothetical protein